MLERFTIVAYRADNEELVLSSSERFVIAQEYLYPEKRTHHPVTGTRVMPASGPHFKPISIQVEAANAPFLAAARATFSQNRYHDFRLVSSDGREIKAAIQEIKPDKFAGVTTLTLELEL